MSERIFYSLLERVGGNGKYQTTILVIWSALTFIIGSTNLFLPFVFYQRDYQCPENYNNCKEYVCNLTPDDRHSYIVNDVYSLPSKFGDYRCDNSQLDLLQSFIYFGGVFGVFVGAFVNELITKRKLLIFTVVGNITGFGIALLDETLLISTIGLFVNMASTAIQMEIVQCFIIETVCQDVRARQITISNISYGLGVTLNGVFFYLLRSYQLYLLILIPICIVILCFLLFYIEETPFDLIITFSAEESLAALNRIAVANGRQGEHKITLAELENIKREFEENEEQKQHEDISILDLFRYDSLRKLTIISLILHYIASFQFVAPQISLRNYSLDIYTNGAVMGFSQLIGCVVCYFIIDHYERKKVIYIAEAVCLSTSAAVFFFFTCSDKHCSQATKIIQTSGLTIFRFASTIAYNIFYMMQYEAYPNQIRGIALQITCATAYLQGVTIPQILTLSESLGISIVFTFILSCILMVVFISFLNETFGIPPPEIIEELEYEHHGIEEKIKET